MFNPTAINSDVMVNLYEKILMSNLFLPKLLDGLYCKYPYIVVQFVNFINHSLDVLCKFLKHPNLTLNIRKVFMAYFDLITLQSSDDEEDTLLQTKEDMYLA